MNEHDRSAAEREDGSVPSTNQVTIDQVVRLDSSDPSASEATRSILTPRADEAGETAGEPVSPTPIGMPEGLELPLGFLSPPERPGTVGRLDHYDILAMIGRGGMGMVLKAFDARLERVVAIKVIAPFLAANSTARKRFVREAQAGAAINHRNVVSIHAVEAERRPPYLVMEFVASQSLADKLRAGKPLPVREIVRLGSEIAAGLAAAHEKGLIHRDIKPANILIEDKTDRVKITDFGLARAASDARLTQSGVVTGTPKYMSPEQALGQQLDSRSDLYSLGSVLYFLCTAHAPFGAETTLAVLNQVVKDDPRPIRDQNPAIPQWLCDLIAKLHVKNPEHRYQSAQEVAELLAKRLASMPVDEPEEAESTTGSFVKVTPVARPKRSRGKGWLVAGSVAMIAIIAVVLARIANSRDKESGSATQVQPGSDGLPDSTPAVYQPFNRAVLADRNAFRAPPLQRLRHSQQLDVSCIPRGFSPDGKWLLTICDGERIVRVWEVATGKVHKELPCFGDLTCGPIIGQKGNLLAVYGLDGVATLWDMRTFANPVALERQPSRIRSAAFDANDETLAIGREDGLVQFWDTATGAKRFEFATGPFPVLGLHYLPDNKGLAIFAPVRLPVHNLQANIWHYFCRVLVVDIDQSSPTFKRAVQQWPASDTHFLEFARSGDQLFFMRNRYQNDPMLAVAHAGTGTVREIKSTTGILPTALLPIANRGVLAAYADKKARYWNLTTGAMEWEIALPSGEDNSSFALHPDGRTVVYGSDDLAQLFFIDLESGKAISSP